MRKFLSIEPLATEARDGLRHPIDSVKSIDPMKSSGVEDLPHRLEQTVQRRLLSHPELRFSSLVIRRIPNGVCLEGVLEGDAVLNVSNVARSVAGVNEVLNHLVVRHSRGSR